MTKIVSPKDCGNSPKSVTVVDLYKHLFKFNLKRSSTLVAEDVVFTIHGHGDYRGMEGLRQMIDDMKTSIPKKVAITNVISHGTFVAAQGEITMNDDSKMAFAEIFEFTGNGKGAKIKKVDSYVVEVK